MGVPYCELGREREVEVHRIPHHFFILPKWVNRPKITYTVSDTFQDDGRWKDPESQVSFLHSTWVRARSKERSHTPPPPPHSSPAVSHASPPSPDGWRGVLKDSQQQRFFSSVSSDNKSHVQYSSSCFCFCLYFLFLLVFFSLLRACILFYSGSFLLLFFFMHAYLLSLLLASFQRKEWLMF